MTDIDTSAASIHMHLNWVGVDAVQASAQTTELMNALLSEREAIAASAEEWMKALGAVLGALPLSEIVSAGASVGETITAVKARFETVTALEAENSALKTQLAEARNTALDEAAGWHDQRTKETPDVFEQEFHEISARRIRALKDQETDHD